MESSMIVMESVDSDKLKPYLRGESEGDSMNDPSLLHDSNGSTEQMDVAAFSAPGKGNDWMGKAVVRGPQSDLLGVLEELEREAEAEAGKEALWPAAQGQRDARHLPLVDPAVALSPGLRPVNSDAQKRDDKQADMTSPRSGDMQSLSAELLVGMPPPPAASTHQHRIEASLKAREPTGQKAVLAGRTVKGDSTTMPFKPTEPFNLERFAHQHLLDLALNDLSPPVSEEALSCTHGTSARGRKRTTSNGTAPGPKTMMRDRALQDSAGVGQKADAAVRAPEGAGASLAGGESANTYTPPANSPHESAVPPSSEPPRQRSLSTHGSDHAQPSPSPRRSGIPSALVIPRPEHSRDAMQKTIYSTMSPTASGILATLNEWSPQPSPGLGRHKTVNASDSTSLLPSPPGRGPGAAQFRTYNSPGIAASDMLHSTLSRIPRSPADGMGQSVDLTGLSLPTTASRLPGFARNDVTRPATHRGSKIPLSPAGSAGAEPRQARSLTPRGKRNAAAEKQGQSMEAATAELDKLAVMLKQMQEDIKAIPSEAGREASHPLPTSPAPPHARKSFSNRRSMLDAAAQSANGSLEGVPGVATPDNESLDKAEKMQETSTTVTVAGARGVRKPLHDAVAEEAEQGFGGGQPSGGLSEASGGVSKASVKHNDASVGLSKASAVKRGEAAEGGSQASVQCGEGERNAAAASAAAGKPKQQAAGGKQQAKAKSSSSKSRSKRLAAEQASKPQEEARQQRHTMDPLTAKAGGNGGNELEGQGPAESQAQAAEAPPGGEVNSVWLQPTEDDLVRVAVGKTSGVEAVIVHASPRPAPNNAHNNDLEPSGPLRKQAESATFAPAPPAPVVQQAAEPVGKGPLQASSAEDADPPPPKCACCFM